MTTRHPIKSHGSSRRSASAAPVARPDTTSSIQLIPSFLEASPDARSWRSHPVSHSRTQDGNQDTSEEESPDRSSSPASYGHSVSDQGTPQSHTSELSRESVERPQNMSDTILGPDPRLFGPLQYNPLSYSEGYASQYYSPSAYSYYPTLQAYQYPTFAPCSAYSVTPTATSSSSSATVKPGSFSQEYPIEGGYMPESTFPGYDGAYGRPYHVAPYRHLQLYPPYRNLHLATQLEGHAEHALNEDTRRKHADSSRKSRSSAKTDEEKRRDMREAVLRKVEEDESRIEQSVQQNAQQGTASSDEHLTPPEYSRKSIPASRQRTEEEENRELRDAFRRRQEDYDTFPAWMKQQEAAADIGKRKEGLEAFVDVVLEKSELSGKRAASQGPPSEPNKEAREQETDYIRVSHGTTAKLMRNVEEPIVDRPTVKSTNFIDTRDKPKCLPTAAGRALKHPPGLPYPAPNALLPEPLSSRRAIMAIQARLEEANNWFHKEDSRKGRPLQVKIEEIARDYSLSKDSEQDRITAKQTTLLIGGVIANFLDYLDGRDAKGLSDPFTMFRYVRSRYCDKATTGRRSYFEIDPLISRRAAQPRRSEKPEKKLVLIRHRRPEL